MSRKLRSLRSSTEMLDAFIIEELRRRERERERHERKRPSLERPMERPDEAREAPDTDLPSPAPVTVITLEL
jgi:hypothetical protein